MAKGIVTDPSGVPLPGVSVLVKDSYQGTTTNIDGAFSLYVPRRGATLQFSFIGYTTVEISESIGSNMVVQLAEDAKQVEEVVVVGYGVQKKMTVTGAVSTAKIKEISKVATPSLSNAIAGQMPGIISRQASGEPGYDAAQIYIRGIATWGNQNPLILVDGIERDLNQINAQEIDSFTILKDASATAVYGARGANGVILITTKRGKVGAPKITFRSETALLTALRRAEYIDGYSYASLMNEARIFNGEDPRWTDEELQKYKDGSDPYLYPNVDWMDEVLKKHTMQTINNLSVSGGTDIIQYYMNVGFTYQNGLYREDPNNKFNTNSSMKRYNFRNNVDVKLSKSLTMQLGLGAIVQNGHYPGFSTSEIFNSINLISPISYPKLNPDGTPGGSQTYVGHNPWGRSTQSGYSTQDHVTVQANLGINWDLSFLLKGLSVRGLFSYDRYAATYNNRPKEFVVKRYLGKDPETGDDLYSPIYREEQPLGYSQSTTTNRAQYSEAQINYARTFGQHQVTAMVLVNQREYVDLSAADSRANIPYRRMGLAGRVTYNFGERYLVEGNFGYNGSENFKRGKQFGFFPSVSLGWVVSNEPFFKVNAINRLKLRVSHGLVGNDVLGIRFGFLSTINTQGQSYYFGDTQQLYAGMEENAIGNPNLTWEKSRKTDIGLDLGLFQDRVVLQLDFFKEKRSDILIQRGTIPSATGIYPWSIPYGNLGRADNKGLDAMLEIRNTTPGGFFYSLRGNFTFARNKIIENDEPKPAYPYLSNKGLSIGQYVGFVAEGFFKDQEEIDASPLQTFGTPRPGDVRYKDINGDGQIDSYDQVPIGYARLPEISFGFGGTIAYKGFDCSVFFSGAANTSINLAGYGMWAFYDGLGSNNVLKEYYDNRWTPGRTDAKYPAIDVGNNPNNFVTSTVWMKNGNYLRLRNAEIGYTFSDAVINKLHISGLRLFVNGTNLLTFDYIKIIDPESNDGTGAYPLQRSVNIGVQIDF
ncbi:TonB-dependent receptor [uncultured Alistipes sp.]|uniref:SusC/RagA family TonB-linked outer membrane protein n=1 Tax=uncultured Alistipes sp. TaxID=538949 RepID=UPI0026344282|nr:TonB-dependent receptor [uncultured Alistipes sp.]